MSEARAAVADARSAAGAAPLLEVRDLKTWFYTQDGIVKAVNGVSYSLREGEALGLVGESGCGKSVSAMSLMRLIPTPPGRIVAGEVLFDGRDLLKVSDAEIRRIRGNDIAMIFQDPMTSLNPVLKVSTQITESLRLHLGMNNASARKRAIELAEQLFAQPRHPYTLGLLRSIPRIDQARHEKLIPIEGLPPDLIAPPPGCPFQPRCPYAVERCGPDNPSLEPVRGGHTIACWVDVGRRSA